jgi:hypothetical protein
MVDGCRYSDADAYEIRVLRRKMKTKRGIEA